VVFDLDGVLLESEQVWLAAKRTVTERSGGAWQARAETEMLGMSSTEWSRYMHEQLAVPLELQAISARVLELVEERYRSELPLIPGAREAVGRLAARWPLAMASSANREAIELVLELAGWRQEFELAVSSEEVARGKPAPDVYLEAARRLGVPAPHCVAVEDSSAGLRSADAAGMPVVAIPNRAFPPDAAALACASVTLASIAELDASTVLAAARRRA
jgi:HAD superfamily hydrolase (TIGR01509 family)